MKKILAVLLCGALLLVGGLPVLAQESSQGPMEPAAGLQDPYVIGREAVVQSAELLENGNARILVETTEETPQEILLNVSEATVLMDNQTALPVGPEALTEGETIVVYHSPAMTRSLPPQTQAIAILVNLEGDYSPAHYLVAEAVFPQEDGSITVLCDAGGMLVTLEADLPVTSLYTKNIVTNQDIQMGTPFFAWYDIVAMSYPGQTYARRAVLLPAAEREEIMICAQDTPLKAQARLTEGVVSLPLRSVAQDLGMEVAWDGITKTVTVTAGDSGIILYPGEDRCTLLDGQGLAVGPDAALSGAAVIQDGRIWAPAEIFQLLLGRGAVRLHGNFLILEIPQV